MDYSLMFPSRFLRSQEFKGKEVTLKIAGVHLEDLATEGPKVKGQAPTKRKGLVSFADTEKLWVINRTNADCLKAMFGRDTDKWIGRRVTLYPAPFENRLTGETTTCIRVLGSPDIAAPVSALVALPLRKPITMRMARTDPKKSTPLPKSEVVPDFEDPRPLNASEVTMGPAPVPAPAPAAPPPSDPPPADPTPAPPSNGSPFAAFKLATPSSKFLGRLISTLELSDFEPAIGQLAKWLEAKPDASWALTAKADLGALRGELAFREAAIDAATGGPPREPGAEG
jgi:hypothetical protein